MDSQEKFSPSTSPPNPTREQSDHVRHAVFGFVGFVAAYIGKCVALFSMESLSFVSEVLGPFFFGGVFSQPESFCACIFGPYIAAILAVIIVAMLPRAAKHKQNPLKIAIIVGAIYGLSPFAGWPVLYMP